MSKDINYFIFSLTISKMCNLWIIVLTVIADELLELNIISLHLLPQ